MCHSEILGQLQLTKADLPFYMYYDNKKYRFKAFVDDSYTLPNMLDFYNTRIKNKKKGFKKVEF